MYKVEYLTDSLDKATKIARDVVSNVDVPFVWIKGPDAAGLTTRTIACVERTRPSWVLSVATEDEIVQLCTQLDPVEILR